VSGWFGFDTNDGNPGPDPQVLVRRADDETMTMVASKSEAVMWAIVDADGRVVVLCSGADAPDFVDEWVHRGYQAVGVDAEGRRAA
jgi:hypothetical protein